jgi:hypothetical protein
MEKNIVNGAPQSLLDQRLIHKIQTGGLFSGIEKPRQHHARPFFKAGALVRMRPMGFDSPEMLFDL